MPRATFPRSARVTSPRDFARARSAGRSLSDSVLRINVLENGLAVTRLGLAVPKRGSAVERNRIKRVIREVFRLRRAALPPGFDLVISPKDPDRARDFDEVGRSFDALTSKLKGR
jgi:ribonuclease P protein component